MDQTTFLEGKLGTNNNNKLTENTKEISQQEVTLFQQNLCNVYGKTFTVTKLAFGLTLYDNR